MSIGWFFLIFVLYAQVMLIFLGMLIDRVDQLLQAFRQVHGLDEDDAEAE